MGRVALRFQRLGRRSRPFYRLVAADSRSRRDGKVIERLGTFNPLINREGKKEARLEVQRIKYWISVGAQPSQAVSRLLSKAGLLPELPRRNELKKRQLVAAMEEKGYGSIYEALLAPAESPAEVKVDAVEDEAVEAVAEDAAVDGEIEAVEVQNAADLDGAEEAAVAGEGQAD